MRSFFFASLALTLVSSTLAKLQTTKRSPYAHHQLARQDVDLDSDVDSDDFDCDSRDVGVGDGNKYATVHYMVRRIQIHQTKRFLRAMQVGNTYTYRLADWIVDLTLIEEAGFDAVALNLGP